nr:virulence factor [Dyadobacter frigoris]
MDKKTPEKSAEDIIKSINYYMKKWNRKSFVLLGYSFGASIVPFIASRMSQNLLDDNLGFICLSPDLSTDFEIHLTDMLHVGKNTGQYDVLEELVKIKSIEPILIFGTEEETYAKNIFKKSGFKMILIQGDHHFDKNFHALAQNISDKPLQAAFASFGSLPSGLCCHFLFLCWRHYILWYTINMASPLFS